jgi:tetratricopeptide (TPR) repeat protein
MNRIIAATLALIASLAIFQQTGLAEGDNKAPEGMTHETVVTFNAGLAAYKAEKYEEARDKFKAVCDAFPAWAPAHRMYGMALEHTGDIEGALREKLVCESMEPGKPEIMLSVATAYQAAGKFDEALEKYRKYLELYPDSKEAPAVKDSMLLIQRDLGTGKKPRSSKGKDNYIDEIASKGASRWSESQMPLSVYIKSGEGIAHYRDSFGDILKQSFAAWADASEGSISFTFTDNEKRAAIRCSWVDDPKELSNSMEGGEAIPQRNNKGEMDRTSILILTRGSSDGTEPTDAHIRQVCLHEIGHALGLCGHSSQPGDVMFAVAAAKPHDQLSERDKKTICMLYEASKGYIRRHQVKFSDPTSPEETSPRSMTIRLNSQGLKASEEHDYIKAIELFQEGLKIDPKDETLYINMGGAYAKLAQQALKKNHLVQGEKYLNWAVDCMVKGGKEKYAADFCKTLIQIAKANQDGTALEKYEKMKTEFEAVKN